MTWLGTGIQYGVGIGTTCGKCISIIGGSREFRPGIYKIFGLAALHNINLHVAMGIFQENCM